MSTGSQKRTRSERVAAVALPPGLWKFLWSRLQQGRVLLRLALAAVVALFLWAVTEGWNAPFAYHLGDFPKRNVAARVEFAIKDDQATADAREQARRTAIGVFSQDPEPLQRLGVELESKIHKVLAADSFADLEEGVWESLSPPLAEGTPPPTVEDNQQRFQEIKEALSAEGAVEAFHKALASVLKPFGDDGTLEWPADYDANAEYIIVQPVGKEGYEHQVEVSNVLIENARANLQNELRKSIQPPPLAEAALAWLSTNLPTTLKLDAEATRAAQNNRAEEVADVMKVYPVGTVLVQSLQEGQPNPIDEASLELLRLEHEEIRSQRTLSQQTGRSLAVFGMWIALYTLGGCYLYYREPRLLNDLRQFVTLLSLVVLTVSLAFVVSQYVWHAEIIPLLLCGMTLAIAYHQELALLVSAAVTLVVVVAVGHELAGAVVLTATTMGAIIVLRQVRSRSKLLSVGFIAAMVAFLTTIGVGTLDGQPLSALVLSATKLSLWSIVAGSLMTCLLPMVERAFRVQTDLSLIELGDPAHPLLQELIRRAPGTYNHSITVASLAEAAAESIGARGLLVRVGAYYHDIGKMLKPGYFIENQGLGDNRHESLVPAMSTLVIIAHVKDGADLARQNRLPQQIIDFIQQHHGTTLVEYFYRQASEQQESDPDSADVDESSFRYPGPKPQSKEAGVLMLADAVESASRVLVEPTPARIESLVEELSMKRLMDGQFDECGLTLEEVRKIGESLVKSLTAVFHGRVKYPDQETA